MRHKAYSYSTLPCGLRCVHSGASGLAEVCGVVINAGSADELPGQEGLAHFVEHTIFKGTARRRSWHIASRMEAVGGELNAFTTKESTTIYATAPRGNSSRALDLIADLVCNASFPAAEIDRERDVVLDEISSYLDIPSEAIFDDIDEIAFASTPLAHNILGTPATLAGFDSATCRRWIETRYRPDNMVLFYSGHLSPRRFINIAARCFEPLTLRLAESRPRPAITSFATTPSINIRRIDTHQAHTVMAAKAPSLFSPERHAMALLTNILGGPGMNSLLNMALRERRGLVYSVDASTALYSSTGLFSIYFGCDVADTDRCRQLASDIITRLADSPLSPSALHRAKRQYIGQLALAGENTENAAIAMGRATLNYGRVTPFEKIAENISNITPAQILEAARSILPDQLVTLTFTPPNSKQDRQT